MHIILITKSLATT